MLFDRATRIQLQLGRNKGDESEIYGMQRRCKRCPRCYRPDTDGNIPRYKAVGIFFHQYCSWADYNDESTKKTEVRQKSKSCVSVGVRLSRDWIIREFDSIESDVL